MPTGVTVCRDCSTGERVVREAKLELKLSATDRAAKRIEERIAHYQAFSVDLKEPYLTHLRGQISGLELALDLIKKERQ